MHGFRNLALNKIRTIAPRFLPFADVATDQVPLTRLLRLSIFQITVGMALVILAGTLNRVMIVELSVPASLVSVMIALPVLLAPLRPIIGHKSDNHASALGLRRFPYIYRGTLLQFGGFAMMPFALLVLSGYAEAAEAPRWIGLSAAALSFLLVGAGLHMVQTAGLALATDLVKEEDHPRVVGLMYVMLLFGMVGSALLFGFMLREYSPGRLIQVIQFAAVATVVLNTFAIWKQEPRRRRAADQVAQKFKAVWASYFATFGNLRLIVITALGTFAFGMGDVVLEPYGGQILSMSVAQTTGLTALLAAGTLVGFAAASKILLGPTRPSTLALQGALLGVPAFLAMILSSQIDNQTILAGATIAVGFSVGLFAHGTLTATIRQAERGQIGFALGVWGGVQAFCAGIGVAVGGLVRDYAHYISASRYGWSPEQPYLLVFSLEALVLLIASVALLLLRRRVHF